ncbi:MAG: tRNA uridine-5-carboxymethylaminomethyl(34) synthesis GTPase MnmE [Rhodocyclaceae bacterium]|nr:tRNA uridine-5-carboxymethylaminomethyl(34) synthesis GTPase MnmE [Rhodocyclaceae bacterium]
MRSYHPDTIVAIATPPGRGGIGVVRVSGRRLGDIVVALAGKMPAPRRVTNADFRDRDGGIIDQGLLIYFGAPYSFTGEDVLELQGHGGPAVMQSLLTRCLELGARLARPGEFTQRAYLNDKIDLAQAEAVADLIDATTAAAARSAVRSLSGEFSQAVHSLVGQVTDLRILIEATLDFPEEEIDFIRDTDAAQRLKCFRADLAGLLRRSRQGSILRSGMHAVLVGVPNVGKSSLLNSLSGLDRAIVTEVPGTTRDTLREAIEIDGIPLHIIDTAGLRDSNDRVERMGIERAWLEIEKADVVLHVVDSRTGLVCLDDSISARLPKGVERLIIENKCDIAHLDPTRFVAGDHVHVRLSAKSGEGVDLLRTELKRVSGWSGSGEDVILARERHIQALVCADERAVLAEELLGQLELCAEELRLAQGALAEITGEFSADDLLGRIFSSFCIGK